jgi:prevent-host-death family protein
LTVPEVSIRELRNHGGEVIDRVIAGEHLTITRDGHRVAELRPLTHQPLTAAALLARWSALPKVDPERLRDDASRVIDSRL